jgi:hypothetical protein
MSTGGIVLSAREEIYSLESFAFKLDLRVSDNTFPSG